jgi:ATP-dependent DNA helicase RecG
MYKADTPVRYIKSIGPTRAKELTKIGITTVGELLERQPLSYLYPGDTPIAEAKEGYVVIKATITQIGQRSPSLMMATLQDDTGKCSAVWYNQPWLLANLRPGVTATFWGRFKGGVLQQPKWTTCEASMADMWGGQYGVHHQTIRAALKEVLSDLELPEMYNRGRGSNRVGCLREYHFPDNKIIQQFALDDLKFDEAVQLQLALAERRRGRRRQTSQPMKCGTSEDVTIMGYFPYDFTEDQQIALDNIVTDMTGLNTVMQRLIHGEVGSGKTAVAFYAAMLAALNGKRTLILCPTTILAHQHWDTLWNMGWKDLALYCVGEEKQPADWYKANIIIGTHAMLNNENLIRSASLVIIDEQQKFGVEQRAKLTKHNPHLLLLSATPIPRTLAATVFGDLDISIIKQLPIKRGTVITKWVLPDRREGMYEIIERELKARHQAYFVYPRISGPEDEDAVSAKRGFREIYKRFDCHDGRHRAGLLTGKDNSEYKATTLRSFNGGVIDILVSTIIAEVGLDNPNATVMVIEGADRFGLSQLHQLRGRVCRSTDTAYCFLVAETSNPTSIARLEAIERTNDGFEIAEEDLRLRGPGEVFSTKQHGLPDLRWVSLVDDYDLMLEAKDLVVSGDVGEGVKEMTRIRYGDSLGLGGVV